MRLIARLYTYGLVAMLAGCMPSSSGGGGSSSSCEPGETRDCTCGDGSDSVRVCEDERLTACQCAGRDGNGGADDPGTGGTDDPGAGGEDGVGGQATPPPPMGGRMPPPCTPECGGRECGPDPACGESCGRCDDDAFCDGGQCRPNDDPGNPPGNSAVSIVQVYLTEDTLGPGQQSILTALFEGEAETGRVIDTTSGNTIALGSVTMSGQMEFTISWDNINALSPLNFGVQGLLLQLIIEIVHPQGDTAREESQVRLVCRGGGELTQACDGVCAPDPDIGCACIGDVEIACIEDIAYNCPNAAGIYDCSDLVQDGTVRGRCVTDLYGAGVAGCIMPTGEECSFVDREGESLTFPCGAGADPNVTHGCFSGVCRRSERGCAPAGVTRCDGNLLVFACLDHGAFDQPYGLDCQTELLGGPEGRCHNDRCIQPLLGGACNPETVICIGGRNCVDIQEGGAGACR